MIERRRILAYILKLFLGASLLNAEPDSAWELLASDSLTKSELVEGVAKKEGAGAYGPSGWSATERTDFLKLVLIETAGKEGRLEVTISGIDWQGSQSGESGKFHFLNMFSNEIGDHHAEDGGTAGDALWTLRAGVRNGVPRYGNRFKVLWSPVGAKRTEGNRYHEEYARMPEDWEWKIEEDYRFKVEWSSVNRSMEVFVNDLLVGQFDWTGQIQDMNTIYIGKAGDFDAWVGPLFRDLKVWRKAKIED